MKLDNAHAVITGAGSGIGAAIALKLAAAGAKVSLMGRRQDKLMDTAARLLEDQQSACLVCDVTDHDSVEAAFAEATVQFGPIDILVNCAGAAPTNAFHKITLEEWKSIIDVNLHGVFSCTSQVINPMRERKSGRIINIASTSALKGYAYVSAYSTAKHGVLGMTRSLALETAKHGITVNAICPGFTDTDIIRESVAKIVETTGRSEEQALKQFISANPQGRLITPDEIAETTVWLCLDGSDSITGQAISVSGGEVM
jgi:NAD(P)-dependent dehydrogenase (short-subunit alcohol dehydrogenase family)